MYTPPTNLELKEWYPFWGHAIPLVPKLGYPLPILNIFVPQTGQAPCVAGFTFFIVMELASFISRFALHFTQYACIGYLLI